MLSRTLISIKNPVVYRKLSNLSFKNKNVEFLPAITQVITNKEAIDKDFGLKQFMNKTYVYTGSGILATMGSGMLLSHMPEMMQYLPWMMGGGFVTGIAGCFGLGWTRYKVHTTHLKNPETNKVIEAFHSENTPERQLSYGAVIGGMSLMISPAIAFANVTGILMPAMLSTGLVFGGAMHYANTRKVGELEPWGSALYGGLWGLIGCGLTGLGSTLLFGPNTFSVFMHSIDLYAGIPLFAGFVAYDTHKAIDMYRKKDPDHLGCSVQLYLDFTNLLIRMIEIMAILNKKD
jgi:FtsH-binding integral membrane protein